MSYTQVSYRCPNLPMLIDTTMTDMQPKNVLLGVLDDSAFAKLERDELQRLNATKKVSVPHGVLVKTYATHKGFPPTV